MSATVLLTRGELAALLRIALRTLDRHRSAGGILDPLPGPGHPVWDANEVTAWLKAGRPSAGSWKRLRGRCR